MLEPIRIAAVNGALVTAVFFYPQATPATDANANPWVPSPSTSLPQTIQDGYTGSEATDLDAGLEVAEKFTFTMPSSMTPAEVLAALRARYADRLAAFPTWYAAQTANFQYVGAKYAAS